VRETEKLSGVPQAHAFPDERLRCGLCFPLRMLALAVGVVAHPAASLDRRLEFREEADAFVDHRLVGALDP